MNHTPGPWEILDSCGEISIVQQDSEMPVCCVSGRGNDDTDTQLLPDAKLIAASPDLLAACIGLMEIAELAMPDSFFQTDSRVVAARNAIAKAQGESA